MLKFLLVNIVLFALLYSCCKDEETVYIYDGVKVSLYQVGASELQCDYPYLYFFKEKGKIYACTNMPDSLNSITPPWINYEINYKLLPDNLKCNVWGNCCVEIARIELISAKRY